MKYVASVICVTIVILVAWFIAVNNKMYRDMPEVDNIIVIDTNDSVTTKTDGSVDYTPGSELAVTDPIPPTGSELHDARAWGFYHGDNKYEDPDQFRKIRVDEWGRVICAPSSAIEVLGWTIPRTGQEVFR